jgi:undecaprenyl-diphosphatase
LTLLQALVLGAVQGLTEFLPVSSSGHLVLANYYLGWGEQLPPYVTFATNTGTLLAVLLALRRDVGLALSGFFRGLGSAPARRGEGWKLALLVIVASVPTVLIGLLLKGAFDELNAALPVSLALIVTGFILWFTPKTGPKDDARQLGWWDAVVAGLAQGLAIFPGVSRSGTTIAALLWRGASNELAPRLSFLMYLVASAGVAVLTLPDLRASRLEPSIFAAMFLSSFVVGYLSLLWLFRVLRRGQFRYFAPYLWLVAAVTLVTLALR